MLTSPRIKVRASELGFDLCGIAPVDGFAELGFLRQWIDRGYAGEMGYMAQTAPRRADVRCVLPSARAVVALATVYNVERPHSTEVTDSKEARVSRYAWGDDYHEVIGERTNALLTWMREQNRRAVRREGVRGYGACAGACLRAVRWPGMDRQEHLPDQSRAGFMAVSLGDSFVALQLEPRPARAFDRCGTCTLCLEACPTGAIVDPWVLDATRCLSYLTIELKGSIPEAHREVTSARTSTDATSARTFVLGMRRLGTLVDRAAWQPRRRLRPSRRSLTSGADQTRNCAQALKGSAMRRAGITRLRRNLAVAIGNSGDPRA